MRTPLSFLAILVLALLACKKGAPSGGSGSGSTTAPAGMTESFASKNGLITAHYPASFAASAPPVSKYAIIGVK